LLRDADEAEAERLDAEAFDRYLLAESSNADLADDKMFGAMVQRVRPAM